MVFLKVKFNKSKVTFLTIAVLIVMIIWTSYAILDYSDNSTDIVSDTINSTQEKTMHNNISITKFAVERYFAELESQSYLLSLSTKDFETFYDELRDFMEAQGFNKTWITYPDGSTTTITKTDIAESQGEFSEEMKNGESFLSEVTLGRSHEYPFISINVPIFSEDLEVVAYLSASLNAQFLANIFSECFYYSDGYYYLIDGKGNVITCHQVGSIFYFGTSFDKHLASYIYEENSITSDEVVDYVKNNDTGKVTFNDIYGGESHGYFAPVGIKEWKLLLVTTSMHTEAQNTAHLDNGNLLIVRLLFAFAILLCVVLFTQKNSLKTARQYELNTTLLSKEINKLIFEWDFRGNKFTSSSDFGAMFGYASTSISKIDDIIATETLHKDDLDAVSQSFSQIFIGHPVKNIQFRLKHANGNFVWCSMTIIPIPTKNGRFYNAMGLLENIDDSVRETQELRTKSERDPLTNLYNKGTTEMLIAEILKHSSPISNRHHLMIIDIDNFKSINDKLGHQYGDTVLKELSASLQEMFRSQDVLGRVGGDEFFVLVKDVPKEYNITEKAQLICDGFSRVYSANGIDVQISASIGISEYPKNGQDFNSLYNNSDIALYDTKANGKNGYTIYNGQKNINYVSNRTEIDNKDGLSKK